MERDKYDIVIKHHTFIRAMQRGITPDRIEETIKCGKIKYFGKNRVKFVKEGKKRNLICVGEIRGLRIEIFTIETEGE